MAETVEFELVLSAKWWRDPPKVNIYIDDVLIESEIWINELNAEKKSKILKFNTELDEGEHSLIVEYLNKTNTDTTIDDDGNILKDQLLFIDGVSVDEIELGNVIRKCCIFYPTAERLLEVSWLQAEIPGQHILGHPGKWVLKFSTPTYLWLLENL